MRDETNKKETPERKKRRMAARKVRDEEELEKLKKENERVEAAIKILQLKGGKKVTEPKMAAADQKPECSKVDPDDDVEKTKLVCVPDKLGVRPKKPLRILKRNAGRKESDFHFDFKFLTIFLETNNIFFQNCHTIRLFPDIIEINYTKAHRIFKLKEKQKVLR